MPNSEHIELTIDGTELDVRRVEAREALSQLFAYEVVAVVSPTLSVDALVGAGASLRIRDRWDATRDVEAVVAEVTIVASDDVEARAELLLRPAVYQLTLGRDCRTFRNQSVPELVDAVLAEHGLRARWELVGSYTSREYVAQYREDDWSFVTGLLASEGIYFWFDHADGSALVCADDSTRAPDVAGAPSVPFVGSSGLDAEGESIDRFAPRALRQTDRFSLRSFDEGHPDLVVSGTHGAGPHHVYDAPGAGVRTSSEAAHQCRLMHEGALARRVGTRGVARCVRLTPGRVVTVTDVPFAAFDGRYLITEATLTVERQGKGVEAVKAQPPVATFAAIEVGTTYRAPRPDRQQAEPGLSVSRVVGPPGEEIFGDERGCVRARMHWDRLADDTAACGSWARVVQRATAGSQLLPRVGWHAWTMNEEGSADRPVIFSRAYDAEHPPPYDLPAKKTQVTYRTLTTPGDGTSNEIRFEASEGAEEFYIHASRDLAVHVNQRKSDRIKANHFRTVGVDALLDVSDNLDVHVVGSQTITIDNEQHETVGTGRQKSVGGDESITISGARLLDVGGSITTDISVDRTLVVGSSQLESTFGDIAVKSPLVTTLVGGAALKMTAAGMQEKVDGVSAQNIGGAKVESVAKSRTLEVKGAYSETVGGLMFSSTAGKHEDTAATSWALQTLGPLSTTAGDELVIEGTKSVTFKCGASTITVTANAVEVSAPSLELDGGALTVKGMVKYN
jgi:type VI secretion system secreted protein VgrG